MFRKKPETPVFIVVSRPRRRVKVHTWFVSFPIEVFWVDIMGEVMAHEILQPYSSAAPKCPRPVRVIIEAPVGMIREGEMVDLPNIGTVVIKTNRR